MEMIKQLIDIFLHLDVHLNVIIQQYGTWTYLILFMIIFCETGLVVTPFLPGDSLLFAAGAFAASGSLRVEWLLALLCVAAVGGDAVNYGIGNYLGPKVLTGNSRFLKKEYIDRTHRFYEKYGGKTIIFARFVPIVRTFAPFLAGVGSMTYWRFASYNVVGGIAWIVSFVVGGHAFGNIPWVKRNFTMVILAIIIISVLPAVLEAWRQHGEKSTATP
ncbi:MAG: DedA family protein [Acidobacteria bacterium]|nr:DedA family protein [Acidobacteriota bacterium]MBI3655230.1 DedA family protein [Acidobacteriota bacterium]